MYIGVVPGTFQRGADSSNKGAKIWFQGTVNARNLRKNRYSSSNGGLGCSDGEL